jgi:hypothetical protein
VDESTTVSPQPVSQFGDLSIGDFISDHIVIMCVACVPAS